MSAHNSDRMSPAPLKNLNAFNPPKLKKFPSRPEQKAPSTQPTAEAENIDTSCRPTSPADVASPVVDHKSSQAPVSKPTTTRKSRRQAKSRASEVTVYYHALQSPDEASTVTKQKPRQPRAIKPAAKHAAVTAELASQVWPADHVPDTYQSDIQPEPIETEDVPPLQKPLAESLEPSRKYKQPATSTSTDDLAPAAPATLITAPRRRSKSDDNKPPTDCPALAAPNQVVAEPQQQQQQPGKAAEGFRDGQEIFKYMQQLAENAAELLPQDEEQEQKKRGRGRAKKDLRLVDALHQSWKGKSYYERLQELTRQEIEEQEQAATAAAPDYKPMHHSQPTAAATADNGVLDSTSQPQPYSSSQPDPGPDATANGRKRRTMPPRTKAGAADSDTDMDDACADAAGEETAPAKAPDAVAGGPSKRRATAAAASAVGRAGPAAAKGGKAAGSTGAAAGAANKARRTAAAGSAGANNKSPFTSGAATGTRPLSSKANGNLAWESTPAAPPSSLAERPPWSVGGSAAAAAAAGAAIGTAGPGAGPTGTAKADRGAVQRLQTALEAKSDELTALREQLKESQEAVAKLRAEHKTHPKALAQLEKQKQALENKVEAVERKQTALERENKGLHEKLAKQEAEKAALQEQLSKSDKELKALRLKLKQSTAKLEKCQTTAQKLQEMCAGLAAEAQPIWIE